MTEQTPSRKEGKTPDFVEQKKMQAMKVKDKQAQVKAAEALENMKKKANNEALKAEMEKEERLTKEKRENSKMAEKDADIKQQRDKLASDNAIVAKEREGRKNAQREMNAFLADQQKLKAEGLNRARSSGAMADFDAIDKQMIAFDSKQHNEKVGKAGR
jgi:hypothetical protein